MGAKDRESGHAAHAGGPASWMQAHHRGQRLRAPVVSIGERAGERAQPRPVAGWPGSRLGSAGLQGWRDACQAEATCPEGLPTPSQTVAQNSLETLPEVTCLPLFKEYTFIV